MLPQFLCCSFCKRISDLDFFSTTINVKSSSRVLDDSTQPLVYCFHRPRRFYFHVGHRFILACSGRILRGVLYSRVEKRLESGVWANGALRPYICIIANIAQTDASRHNLSTTFRGNWASHVLNHTSGRNWWIRSKTQFHLGRPLGPPGGPPAWVRQQHDELRPKVTVFYQIDLISQ